MSTVKSPVRRSTNRPATARRINTASFRQARASSSSVKSSSDSGGIITKILNSVILGSLSIVFFLSPIFITGLVAQGLGFEKITLFLVLTSVAFISWVAKGFLEGGVQLRRTPIDWLILVFLAVATVSSFSGVSVKDSLVGPYGSMSKGLISIIGFIVFYYLVVNNLTKERAKCYFWSLLGSGGLIIVLSLAQIFGLFLLPFGFAKSVSFNIVGSFSSLTIISTILLPLLFVVLAKASDILKGTSLVKIMVVKMMAGVLLVIDLMLLGILSGFTYWPAVIVVMVVLLALMLFDVLKVDRRFLGVPATIIAVVVIFGVYNMYVDRHNLAIADTYKESPGEFQNNVKKKFDLVSLMGVQQLPAEVSLRRAASWDIAKESIGDYPLLGTGPATYYHSFSKHKGTDFNQTNLWNIKFDNASGVYFELLSTLGILGFLSALLIAFVALFKSVKVMLAVKDENEKIIFSSLVLAFISVVFFALLFGFNSTLIIFSVLISVLTIGYSVLLKEDGEIVEVKVGKGSLISSTILAFVGIISLVILTKSSLMFVADSYAKKSMLTTDTQKKVSLLERAVKMASFQDSYHLALSNHYVALANQALSQGDEKTANLNLDKGIEHGKRAVELSPSKSSNHESLALVYENAFYYTSGALEFAEKSYQKFIELEPDSPTPYLRLGLINMAKARLEASVEEKKFFVNEAIKMYDESIARKSNLASAHYGKSTAHEALGDLNTAIQSLTNATILNQNAGFIFELGRLYFNRGVLVPALIQGDEQVKDLVSDGEDSQELSVKQVKVAEGVIEKNSDLATSEQLFLSILLNNQNHANARYSLALLYNKVGDTEKASIMVKSLLKILGDEKQKEAIKQQFPGLY